MQIQKGSTLFGLLATTLLALGLFAYAPVFNNGFVDWDDPLLITSNPHIRGINGENLKAAFTTYDPELYIPLTIVSYQLNYQIGKLNPTVFHATNVLLHIGNAFLVLLICYLLSNFLLPRRKDALIIGFVAAVLFLLHPLHTETVAWASARKDVLSTFFYLGSLLTYIHTRTNKEADQYILSIILCGLALLSKVMAITLPLTLILVDIFIQRKRDKTFWGDKIPYVLLSLAFLIIGLFGKTAIIDNSTLFEKILMAGKSTVFYLQHLVWPTGLSALHPYTEPIVLSSADFFLPLLFVLIAGVTLFLLRRRHVLLFGTSFFAITLAPTFLNFAKAGDVFVASERYAYLPSLGLFFIVAYGLYCIAQKTKQMWIVGIVTLVIAVPCMIATQKQARTWNNTETLALQILSVYPQSYRALDFLGNHLKRNGNFDQALAAYSQALATKPDAAKVRSNLGSLYAAMGQQEKEIAEYERAMQDDPTYIPLRYNLSLAYIDADRINDAHVLLKDLYSEAPDFLDTRLNLAETYMAQGTLEEAGKLYAEQAVLTPENEWAIRGLHTVAQQYLAQGKELEEWMQLSTH